MFEDIPYLIGQLLGGMIYECAILSSAVIGLFRYRGKHIEKNQGGTQ